MLKKNDTIKTTIINYGCNAEGVAKVDGQVVFVPYTLVDEQITATIINDKNKFLIGKATNIDSPNKSRVEAPCPYFTKCGGCQLQHCNYSTALEIKQKIVQDAIDNIAKINYKVMQCVPSQNIYNYRNKIAMPINPKSKKVGLYRLNSHNIVDIEHCLLQKNNINKLIDVFNTYLKSSKCTIFDETTKTGLLKTLVAREIQNQILITVVINGDDLPDKQNLIDLLKNNFDNFGLNLNINKLCNNVILSNDFVELYGIKNVEICENGIAYKINNKSFLQVNEDIKNKIYSSVFEEICDDIVIDAYSGAGLLSALMAKHAKKVYGIEIVKPATEIADNLKQQNNICNLSNINGDCAEELPKLLKILTTQERENLSIVLDPPRKGCDNKVLSAIKNVMPKKIIYISCNPSTLARDLNILLADNNYQIKKIQPYDMFPQTKHVETLAILNKIN